MIELWDSWGPMFVDFSTTGPGPAYPGSAHGIPGEWSSSESSSTAYGDIFVASKGCMDWLLIHICNVHIYIYVYIYIIIYIQLYIHTTIYVCTCTCTYMYVDTYTYTIIHLLRYTHVYIYICNVIPCPYILVYLFTICIMSTPDS